METEHKQKPRQRPEMEIGLEKKKEMQKRDKTRTKEVRPNRRKVTRNVRSNRKKRDGRKRERKKSRERKIEGNEIVSFRL